MALESLPKIAPALFSAEQDLIQIYNKKSDTVGTINASLLGGSTPPSGVSGAIQFSTGSAFGSDSANLFWDNVNKRLGINNNAPTNPVSVGGVGTNGSINFNRSSDGANQGYIGTLGTGITLNGGTSFIYMGTTNTNAIGTSPLTTLGAMWGIRGSGSTSATTSLLVQNSAGSEAFRVRDDGRTLANSGISVSKDGYVGFQSNGIYNSFGYQMNPEDNLTVLKVGFGVGTSVTTLLKVDNTLNSTASGPTTKPLVILANASQTANLVELQNSSGTALSVFTADGKLGVGIPTPVGKAEVLVGFADPSSLAQAESFRLRSTTVDGNTRVMNFGISHTGVGGANQGYGYIQFGYSGGSADNPLVLQPLAGGVSVGSPLALSDYKLQVLQESSIKAAANTGGGALGGRLSFPPAGPYSGKVAYIAQVQDGISWTTSAGLVFATASSGDISGSTGTERMRISGSGNLGVGEVNPLAKTHIKGSGSTSATTSLLVQNSSANETFKVLDDGRVYIGTNSTSASAIYVPRSPTYGSRAFLYNQDNNAMMRTISNDEMGVYLNCYFDRAVGIWGNFTTQLSMTAQLSGANSTSSLIINSGTNWATQANGTCIGINLQPVFDTDASSNSAKYIGFYWNPNIADLQSAKHYGIQTTSGGAYINTTTPQTSACLQADSTTQGFLPPRMTDAQIRAIASPANGLIAYNTTIDHLCVYQGGAWVKINHSPM